MNAETARQLLALVDERAKLLSFIAAATTSIAGTVDAIVALNGRITASSQLDWREFQGQQLANQRQLVEHVLENMRVALGVQRQDRVPELLRINLGDRAGIVKRLREYFELRREPIPDFLYPTAAPPARTAP